MFREMRRKNQQLSYEDCVSVLENEPRGVLAVHGEDGYPYALPMDYVYIDDKIYFHCAKAGHKIDAIDNDDRVSFCVMDKGYRNDGEWALNIKSVIIFGKLKKVNDGSKASELLKELALKYYPTASDAEREVEKAGDRALMLELTIDHMTGKLVNES